MWLFEVDGVEIGGQAGVEGQVGEDNQLVSVGPGIDKVIGKQARVQAGVIGAVILDYGNGSILGDQEMTRSRKPLEGQVGK